MRELTQGRGRSGASHANSANATPMSTEKIAVQRKQSRMTPQSITSWVVGLVVLLGVGTVSGQITFIGQHAVLTQNVPDPDPPVRAVITTSELEYTGGSSKYVGAFKLPAAFSGTGCTAQATANAQGVTFRYEGATLHLLVQAGNPVAAGAYCLNEYTIPALVTSGTYNTASVAKAYGVFGASVRVDQNGTQMNPGTPMGIWWDEDNDLLYSTYMNEYNACCPNNPSLVQSTLNYSAGTGSAIGSWRFSNIGVKAVQGGVLPLPSYWADQYTPGLSLAVGFGGNFAAGGTGSNSMGPTLIAIAAPDIMTNPQGTALSNTPLMYYNAFLITPGQAPPYRFLRGATTPTLNSQLDSWGANYWTWDPVGSCVWIYNTTEHGVVCNANVAAGWVEYITSQVGYQQGVHRKYLIDPQAIADRANVYSVAYDDFFDIEYGSANSPPDIDYGVYPVGPAAILNVSSLTRSGSTATVVTSTAHGLGSGDQVLISGATPTNYNGGYSVSVSNSTTFTYTVSGSPATPATGTITSQRLANLFAAPMSSGEAAHGIGSAYDPTSGLYVDCVPARPNGDSLRATCYLWDFIP